MSQHFAGMAEVWRGEKDKCMARCFKPKPYSLPPEARHQGNRKLPSCKQSCFSSQDVVMSTGVKRAQLSSELGKEVSAHAGTPYVHVSPGLVY
jgi:hypothetical protein